MTLTNLDSQQIALDKIRSAIPEVRKRFANSSKSVYHRAALLIMVYASYQFDKGNLKAAMQRALREMQMYEKSRDKPPLLTQQPHEWEGAKLAIILALGTSYVP